MNKEEFEKLFAAAAEKSGVAELTRKNQFAKNLESMMCELRDKLNSLPAESSEDLQFLATSLEETIGTSPHSRETIIDYLQKAAQWQKEQMMKSAIDAVIVNDETSGCVVDCEQGCLVLEPHTYPIGQKLKILIIKENEQ